MTDQAIVGLEKYHSTLNRDGIIDPAWYRRDRAPYECVCYINNIVAAYYSSNYEVMAIFLRRAHQWLTKGPNKHTIADTARSQLLTYLTFVTKYLAQIERGPSVQPD